jgi:hypothetical protein
VDAAEAAAPPGRLDFCLELAGAGLVMALVLLAAILA